MPDKDNSFEMLEAVIFKQYESAKWTHKINEKQAEVQQRRASIVTVIDIMSTALTASGVFAWITNNNSATMKYIALLMSSIAIATTLFARFFDFGSRAKEFKSYAVKYLEKRNMFECLLLKVKTRQEPITELTSEYKMLLEQYNALCKESPLTDKKSYKLAEAEIKNEVQQ